LLPPDQIPRISTDDSVKQLSDWVHLTVCHA
jgi:hypothetical protein